MQFRPRALYAEKDCVFQKWQKPSPFDPHFQPKPTSASQMRFHDSQDPSTTTPTTMDRPEQIQINPRTMGEEMYFNGPMGVTNDHTFYQSNQSQIGQAQTNLEDITQLQHIPPRCGPNEYSFEKTFGYDLRYARRERAPIPSRPGVISYCKEECIRMGDRCLAFVIEYGDKQQQNCYFLDEAALENRNQLNKLAGSSYNEKICLRGIFKIVNNRFYILIRFRKTL